MSGNAPEFVSINGLAKALGVDWHTAKKYERNGIFRPVRSGPNAGKFNVDECRRAHEVSKDPEQQLKGALGAAASTGRDIAGAAEPFGGSQFMRAKTARAVLEAQARDLQLKKLKGELISRADAKSACAAVAHELRTRFEGLPSAAAPVVHAASSVAEAEVLLRGMIRALLLEVAKLGNAVDAV